VNSSNDLPLDRSDREDTHKGDILVVDDKPDNLKLLSFLLSKNGYKVRQATSGEMALETVQNQPPDLILLDILMPNMNGYEVCRQLKASTSTAEIPVIFLSALSDTFDKVKAFELGGRDYITKPFQIQEILARVENQLIVRRQQVMLQQEIRDRQKAEIALQEANLTLENRVQERTTELESALSKLQVEVEEHKRAEDRVQLSLERERELSDLRSRLIATLSHEFRTPLSLIIMASEAIEYRYDRLEPQTRERKFSQIRTSVERITQILDDALMSNEAELGELSCYPLPINLTEFCQGIITKYQEINQDTHAITLESNIPPHISIYLDPSLFDQIISRLLANSIRYSPKGGSIRLELKVEDSACIMQVHDEGIGIPEADWPNIFEKFYRASNANTIPGTPGTGLGLAIVKQAVELHGGTISVASEIDKGTTFTILLPKAAHRPQSDLHTSGLTQ
jgi:two-component system, sensor histidine kinase and response regulator